MCSCARPLTPPVPQSRFLHFKVTFREQMQGGYFGGGYWGAATDAAHHLDPVEEDDCLRFACQVGTGVVRM